MDNVRDYVKNDYSSLCEWMRSHGLVPLPESVVPSTGAVVDGVAMGFLYLTNSSYGVIEHYVSNPEASVEDRDAALQMITARLLNMARENDVKILGAASSRSGIVALAEKNGFKHIGNQSTFLRMV